MTNHIENIKAIKKELKDVEPFVDFYGQIPTETSSNEIEFHQYIKKQAELQSYILALKTELEFLMKRENVLYDTFSKSEKGSIDMYRNDAILWEIKRKIEEIEQAIKETEE